MLAFISIGSRGIEYFAITSKPNTAWMLQQARNLLMELDDRNRQVRFLIHDRNAKFPHAFDALLSNGGVRIIRTPVKAPNANAHMERWVGTVRRECLDRLLILGRRQLEHILRVYVTHYNRQRPHRALDLEHARLEASPAHRNGHSAAGIPCEPTRPTRRPDSRVRTRRRVRIEFLHPTRVPGIPRLLLRGQTGGAVAEAVASSSSGHPFVPVCRCPRLVGRGARTAEFDLLDMQQTTPIRLISKAVVQRPLRVSLREEQVDRFVIARIDNRVQLHAATLLRRRQLRKTQVR